jgi:AraC-like DNA-binding protein
MRPDGMVAVLFLRALLDHARRAGVDPQDVLTELGVSPSVLDDINGWIPVDLIVRAWTLVPQKSGDPDFGLHSGENTPPGAYGVLEFAAMSSPTAADALERVTRYYRMLGAMVDFTVRLDAGRVRLGVNPAVPMDNQDIRHFVDHFFTLLVSRTRMLMKDDFGPVEVRFAYARPKSTAEHMRVFRAPVSFGNPSNELIVDKAVLDSPLRTANPMLSDFLEESSSSVLAKVDEDMVDRVRRAVRRALRDGDARLRTVARMVGTSGRTLQRKLSERGVAYADLLDEVRSEVASQHVSEGALSLGEIAFLLGFSHTSTFHRAFKRWTGTTPKAFRDAKRLAAATNAGSSHPA